MIVTVTGGSGSGKSEYSENLLLRLCGEGRRFYVATMYPYDEESRARIRRHRKLRSGKGFETLECPYDLKSLGLSPENGKKPSALLECMSNLAANELFMEQGAGKDAADEILSGVKALAAQTEHLVIVTNEVFSDGLSYDESTDYYREVLGELNRRLAELSDSYVEVVYGIPVCHKGALL